MSAPRLISPILDGFQLGEVCARHGAVQCCMATEQQSGEKFIVKIISVPASGTQMDALLLTGAFSDRANANAYFKEQARDILNEAKTLRHMATLGGFTDYDCVQVVPAEQGNGFDIYLLSPWRMELQQMLQREDLTQLDILNMGLDLCAALSACRHAGYLYANLKPGNVFRIGRNYRIGDLGFIPLSGVGKAPLPEKLRGSYTPPELADGTRPVNDTADVYALGLIMYQAYNGGVLPGEDAVVGKLLAPPKYADYEMAEIILRACALDPAIRWRDPEQMGRALTRYMQRNGLHDTPVIPPALREMEQRLDTVVEDFLPEEPDEPELPIPAWDMPDPGEKAASPATEAPIPTRRRKRTPPSRRTGRIAIAVLTVILLAELIVGIWLFAQPGETTVTDFHVEACPDGERVTITIDHTGPAPDAWTVVFTSETEGSRSVIFSGGSTVAGILTAGTEYTFTISLPDGTTPEGETQLVFTMPDTHP